MHTIDNKSAVPPSQAQGARLDTVATNENLVNRHHIVTGFHRSSFMIFTDCHLRFSLVSTLWLWGFHDSELSVVFKTQILKSFSLYLNGEYNHVILYFKFLRVNTHDSADLNRRWFGQSRFWSRIKSLVWVHVFSYLCFNVSWQKPKCWLFGMCCRQKFLDVGNTQIFKVLLVSWNFYER